MSKEFKIANWKVEVDWNGMTLAPVENQTRQPERKRRKPAPRSRQEAAAAALKLQRTKAAEQGEYQAWV